MSLGRFVLFLAIITLTAFGLSYWISDATNTLQYYKLSMMAIFLFIVLSISIYFFSKIAITSKNIFFYSRISLGFLFFKLFLFAFLVLLFQVKNKPVNRQYIISFLVVYLLFSVYDVYILVSNNKTLKNINQDVSKNI